ncbi:MAG TPA: peptidoglycan binding domain-containing protein, partial [Thermomicrobiales bacterium]|nr:peptidoglycan binding domain-containing protein [Thermomicrobiales bacterium]
ASVAAAMAYGRAGSLWDESRAWARGLVRGVDLPASVSVAPAQAETAFRHLAPAIVRAPTDARVDMTAAGQPQLVPDAPGVAIDLQATLAGLLAQAARLDAMPAPIVTMSPPASVSAASLSPRLGDARAAVDAALVVTGGALSWQVGQADLKRIVAVDPATAGVQVDRRALQSLVTGIAQQIDRAPANFGVAVDSNGKLAVVDGGDLVKVDVAASVDALQAALLAGKHDAALTMQRRPPGITEAMAGAAVKQGETLLNTPIAVAWPGGSTKLDRGDLLKALTIQTQPGRQDPFVFGLDRKLVGDRLDAIAQSYDIPVQDAQFRIIDGQFAVASKEQAGRALDIPAGVDSVIAAFGQAKPAVTLRSVTLPPK